MPNRPVPTRLAVGLLAAVLAATPALGSASPAAAGPAGSASPAATTPTVDMEAVVQAAQIDPRRADDTTTPGAKASVLLVEQALQAKGLLDPQWVDGYFGTTTVTAYAAWQRSLGYSGLDATGLPGTTSLTRLGVGRFTVTRPIGPGAKLDQGGGIVVDARGGVVDISVAGWSIATRATVVRDLRTVGFAAWLRDPNQGDWPYHIHAAAISDTDQSSPAQHQTGDYVLGFDGLADHGPDDGPRGTEVTTPPRAGFCVARFKFEDAAGRIAFPGNRPVNFQLVVGAG